MLEIGHALRQAREAQGLSLEEISSSTMIAKKYLRALETEEFEAFPGEVYLKGALRKYATELKLDPESLLARYNGSVNQPESPPKAEKAEKALVLPTNMNLRRFTSCLRLVLYLLLIALLVMGVWTIGNMLLSERPPGADPPLTDNGQNGPTVPGGEEDEIEEPVREVRLVPDEQNPLLFYLYNAETIEADLSFTARCWTRVHVDGSELFEETFSAGQSRAVTANEDVLIRIGYPSGARLTINDIEISLPRSTSAINITINNAGTD